MISGKVVVITGASGAIGSAVTSRFAEAGNLVVLNSKERPENCERQVNELQSNGKQAVHYQADVSTPDGAASLMRRASEAFGGIDVLCNIAGATVGGGDFADLKTSDWEAAFAQNLYTAVNCSQAVLRYMEGREGRIINTSSVRGLWASGRPAIMAYSLAKGALVNFTSTLAKVVAPGILVNAIAPGFVWTANYEAMPEELRSKFIDATLVKRFLTADEMADGFLFLAATTCITGQTLVMDGGFSLIMD